MSKKNNINYSINLYKERNEATPRITFPGLDVLYRLINDIGWHAPLLGSHDAMLGIKEILMKNKTIQPVSRKIWPMIKVQDKEEWMRGTIVQRMIVPPGQPRSKNVLRPKGLVDSVDTFEIDNPESFHCAIGSILGVAECFGLLPVAGVRASSPRKLVFKKISLRTIYAVIIMIMLSMIAIVSFVHMIQTLKPDTFGVSGGIAAATAGFIFYGNSVLGATLFMRIAPRWVSLQRDWRSMEQLLDRNKHRPPRLRLKFSMVTAVVMIFALIEHMLSMVINTPPQLWSSTPNLTLQDVLQFYCEKSHAFVFSIYDYNLVVGILIFISSKMGTFTWNFTDLFLMLISTGLAERYKTLNQRLMGTLPLQSRNVDWSEFREAYAILSSLVKRVDNDLSPIILLSFANNLYFICLQLLNGLSPRESDAVTTSYFFGSLAFLVGRTIAVTLLAARINDQSKLALPALYNCSSSNYNIETQRLLQQITTDDVSLTGMRFFSITRNFMLAVAGAIVTYEVVLLQFNVAMNK